MKIARRVLSAVTTLSLAGSMTLGGLTVAGVDAHAASSGVAHLFPKKREYPAGYQVLGTHASHHPGPVFGDTNARNARHFVVGATGGATNQGAAAIVTIEIGQFRSNRDARRFEHHFHTGLRSSTSRPIRHLGAGAIFVSGGCGCGTTEGELYLWRGAVFANVETVPTNLATSMQLAKAIDDRLASLSWREACLRRAWISSW